MSKLNSRTEFVLSNDGKIIKRTINEEEREVTAAQLAALSASDIIFHNAIFNHPSCGYVNVGIRKTGLTMAARLSKIRIKANYTIHRDALVPAFDRPDEPVFDISWNVTDDIKVFFVVALDNYGRFVNAYIPVIGDNKRCYRLPLGNIYNTGAICLGEARITGSAQQCFNAAFDQFDRSEWNIDLYETESNTIVRKLFRFKPNGDTFEQLPPTSKWADVCEVIAPPILDSIKL